MNKIITANWRCKFCSVNSTNANTSFSWDDDVMYMTLWVYTYAQWTVSRKPYSFVSLPFYPLSDCVVRIPPFLHTSYSSYTLIIIKYDEIVNHRVLISIGLNIRYQLCCSNIQQFYGLRHKQCIVNAHYTNCIKSHLVTSCRCISKLRWRAC